ncbi:hypothetical protein ABW16_21400 [Mycolicibacter heraklionensis]|uniref:Uncharacterized protein n=1 Tax=Mycolicibacter heraklionensis TaxID=512402 RepID=A0ABR5F9Z9_9MYCO|nr:hypothetical protein [Mycolicibacter heraklionensis]KLO25875.1 hypothetical protein ABW16_21400 [Mycolicibacter heraklionensis]
MTDYAADPDLDRVADIAAGLHERLVDDPGRLFDELVNLWASHPAKAAQVTMCLVAWFDPDATCSQLWHRVELTVKQRAA